MFILLKGAEETCLKILMLGKHGGVNGSMQHPVKPAQNVDFSRTSIPDSLSFQKGAKNQLLCCKNPERTKTSCLRRTSDSPGGVASTG